MRLSSTVFLASLLPLALASEPFSIIAARSASPIHLQSVEASGQSFWIGKGASSYCPDIVAPNCPPGTQTALVVSGDVGGCSMDAEVPGGQRVYVAPNGRLGFTQAHSSIVPTGAALSSFALQPGASFGTFSFAGLGATGFLACPTKNGTGPWQIFANVIGLNDTDVPGGCVRECLGFDALAPTYTASGPAAWQYV